MRTENFTFLSVDGKTNIHAVKWTPDSGEYSVILQITHGMVEYIERYTEFAEYMTANGYMVVGHDHLGHGDSIQTEDDLGYFTKENPSDSLIEDMNKLRILTQAENPGIPYFMFGHSMGSYMLRKYLAKYNDDLSGAIICGTGFMPQGTTKMGLSVVKVLKAFKGDRYRSKMVQGLTYDKPYKKYDVTGANPENSWLSRNVENVKKYYKDPKCTYMFTLNGYQGLLEAVLFSCKQKSADAVPNDMPVFIVSGADDPVGNLGVGVKSVYEMFKSSGQKDLSMKLYEEMRHEILNEVGREEVYKDLLGWLNARI